LSSLNSKSVLEFPIRLRGGKFEAFKLTFD